MASGTISLSYSNSYWRGEIRWSSTPNTNGNYSTVTAYLYMWKRDGEYTSGAYKGSMTVGGNYISISNYHSLRDEICTSELSTTVYHNSDGTGTCYIYAELNGPSGTSLKNASISGGDTVVLDTIPRASSLGSVSSTNIGSACNVTWQPLSSSFSYRLRFSMGSYEYTTGHIYPNTDSSYLYTGYTVPYDVANQIPNSTSGTMSVSLYSYNNGSQVGSASTKTFTVTLPDNIVPSISSCSAKISNTNSALANWGIALAGYSKARITASASGVYGSTIRSFTISGSYSNVITGSSLDYTGEVITTSGNKVFTVTCTDSRGRTSSAKTTGTLTFLSYKPPKARKLSMKKDDKGDNNASNDRMVATATWEIDSIGGRNSATAKIYYKISSATDWTVHSGNPQNGVAFELTDFVPDELLSYNFKVVVIDALGNSSEKDAFSSTTIVLLDFKAGGDGLGVGKICENPGMEVAMEAKFYNEIYVGDLTLEEYILAKQNQPKTNEQIVNLVYPVGSIYMSVSSTSPASLFGGSWTQLQDRFLLGAGTTYTTGATGGEATHTLTTDEMPAHNHWGCARFNYDPVSGGHPSALSDGVNSNLLVTDYAGNGYSHNNMPPYLVVYMWRRVS